MNMDYILGYSHTIEYSTASRMNEQEVHATIWVEFIVLSEKV